MDLFTNMFVMFFGLFIFDAVWEPKTGPGKPGRCLKSFPEGVASFSLSMGPWRATGTPFITDFMNLYIVYHVLCIMYYVLCICIYIYMMQMYILCNIAAARAVDRELRGEYILIFPPQFSRF